MNAMSAGSVMPAASANRVSNSQDRPAVSLTPLLHESRVGWDMLNDRYGALLRLVDTVLGVVPDCDRYLEIWPPAFRTYNILVPNLLNLPVPVLGLGGPPPGVVGLSMYVASRTAGCPYCSAHSCSFAMRRGASPDKVAAALVPDRTSFTRGELATIAVARSLARVPCELTAGERGEPSSARCRRRWGPAGHRARPARCSTPPSQSGQSRRSTGQNLDPTSSVVGVECKVLAGAIFAEIVGDERLADDIGALARHAGIDRKALGDTIAYARSDGMSSPAGSRTESASLALARAASYSPARIDAATVHACQEGGLSPAAVVEIITWLSVLQMLHRLTCYMTVGAEEQENIHHDGTSKPRLEVGRDRGTPREGLRPRVRHHPHGRVEPGVPLLPVGPGSNRADRRRPVQGPQQGSPRTALVQHANGDGRRTRS